jgi:hypothetical protein
MGSFLQKWTAVVGFDTDHDKILGMAATLKQRQISADVLRAGGTQKHAADASGVGLSTIKRWLQQPDFLAMVESSPDIRVGAPASINERGGTPESQRDERSRMWVAGSDGDHKVLGRYIPPAAYETAGGVVHVHVVPPDAVEAVVASIEAGAYPTESPYIPVPLAGLDEVLENLPLICRLGCSDQRESLMAWLELWSFIDEDGRTRTLAEALWGGQQRFLDALLSDGHVISIKARKVGLSTIAYAHAAWTARIRDVNASVHLLSYRELAAREALANLRRGFEGLPVFLRLPLVREMSTVLSFAAGPSDTRSLKVFPATPNAAIEATSSHLVLDEWAHTFDPQAVWTAVEPTLPPRATSALITTAGSPGDFVHDYYKRSEAGATRHTPVFVSVLERPDRSLAWLEEKRRQEGKLRSIRNYPRDADEAFAQASEPYFAYELLEAAQHDALPPSPARKGDRYLKAWDIGRKDASVCVVLRAPSRDEGQVLDVVGYERLVGEDYPMIQRAIEAKHAEYPGQTVIETNSAGSLLIQNLRMPSDQIIEHTTTEASKRAMLTEIELRLQQQTLKIHRDFHQLLAELADYRFPDKSITQDSVMALGFAVANANHAHARTAGGSINRELLNALNGGAAAPPSSWLDRQKITTDGPSFGLISGHYPPDPEHGGVRFPYQAEIEEIPSLLTKGWTPDDPASLEKFGYRIDGQGTLTRI